MIGTTQGRRLICVFKLVKMFTIFKIKNAIQRSYAERVRGEARKKWLQQIINTAETSGANLDPVYKTIFQSLYRVCAELKISVPHIFYALDVTKVIFIEIFCQIFSVLSQ